MRPPRLHRAFVFAHLGGLGIDLLGGNGIDFLQLAVAFQIAPRVFQQRLIAAHLPAHLLHGGLRRARIQLRQHLPALDWLAFLKTEGFQPSIQPRLYGNGVGGCDRAQRAHFQRHGARNHGGHAHRQRLVSARAGSARAVLRRFVPPQPRTKREDEQHDKPRARAPRLAAGRGKGGRGGAVHGRFS